MKKKMTFQARTMGLLVTVLLAAAGCSSGNLEAVKQKAPEVWQAQGFEAVAYEGYHWGFWGMGTNYGGACVWHRLKKVPDNGITYSGYVQRWGDEFNVYGPYAADAISPGGR